MVFLTSFQRLSEVLSVDLITTNVKDMKEIYISEKEAFNIKEQGERERERETSINWKHCSLLHQ